MAEETEKSTHSYVEGTEEHAINVFFPKTIKTAGCGDYELMNDKYIEKKGGLALIYKVKSFD